MTQTALAGSDTGLTLKELARRNGLATAGRLPSLPEYARQIWAYRHFIAAYSNAKVSSSLGTTRLGMIWQVLTPLINAGVYYVIFGLIIGTSRGVTNFIPYLCIGVFIFGFTQSTVQAGVQSITSNLGLIRALHFPRASLPISVAMIEGRNVLVAMVVLLGIVLGTGEPVTWEWLLVVPALFLQAIFNAGFAMFVARLGSKVTDLKQLVPFLMRIWMYGSAVIFPVTQFQDVVSGWKLEIIEANPMLIFIDLMRHALMENVPLAAPAPVMWAEAIGWTLLIGIGGFVYFWRGEKGYGRG
jgi:teichoic acid transport system permease protein